MDSAMLTYLQHMAGSFSKHLIHSFSVFFYKAVLYKDLNGSCEAASMNTADTVAAKDAFADAQSNGHGLFLYVSVGINILQIFKRGISGCFHQF